MLKEQPGPIGLTTSKAKSRDEIRSDPDTLKLRKWRLVCTVKAYFVAFFNSTESNTKFALRVAVNMSDLLTQEQNSQHY